MSMSHVLNPHMSYITIGALWGSSWHVISPWFIGRGDPCGSCWTYSAGCEISCAIGVKCWRIVLQDHESGWSQFRGGMWGQRYVRRPVGVCEKWVHNKPSGQCWGARHRCVVGKLAFFALLKMSPQWKEIYLDIVQIYIYLVFNLISITH